MTEDGIKAARNEIRIAQKALFGMRQSNNFEDFEDEWKTYLASIEKAWVKTERSCQHIRNKFQPWQGTFLRQRKKDPLLRYLKHARNSDHHSIQGLAEQMPGSFQAIVPGGGFTYIEKLVTGPDGRVVEYKGNKPIEITELPDRIELTRVKDGGNWYNAPTSHLGELLEWPDPFVVAELGIKYYEKYIHEVEEKFFS